MLSQNYGPRLVDVSLDHAFNLVGHGDDHVVWLSAHLVFQSGCSVVNGCSLVLENSKGERSNLVGLEGVNPVDFLLKEEDNI